MHRKWLVRAEESACGIVATTADVTGVGEETKCWLQRVVEGTLWYPWILPEKSWESFGEA